VLIDAQKLLHELSQKKANLMQDTFSTPPPDYAGFMKAVGKYSEILELERLARELARQQD
jgi:hypothetical protein